MRTKEQVVEELAVSAIDAVNWGWEMEMFGTAEPEETKVYGEVKQEIIAKINNALEEISKL